MLYEKSISYLAILGIFLFSLNIISASQPARPSCSEDIKQQLLELIERKIPPYIVYEGCEIENENYISSFFINITSNLDNPYYLDIIVIANKDLSHIESEIPNVKEIKNLLNIIENSRTYKNKIVNKRNPFGSINIPPSYSFFGITISDTFGFGDLYFLPLRNKILVFDNIKSYYAKNESQAIEIITLDNPLKPTERLIIEKKSTLSLPINKIIITILLMILILVIYFTSNKKIR